MGHTKRKLTTEETIDEIRRSISDNEISEKDCPIYALAFANCLYSENLICTPQLDIAVACFDHLKQ